MADPDPSLPTGSAPPDPGIVVEHAPDAVLVVGRDGRVVDANRRCGEVLGYRPGELGGRPVSDVLAGLGPVLERARTDGPGAPHRLDLLARRHDGTEAALEVHVSALPGSEGHVVVVARDLVTRHREQEAAGADRARSEFLSRMSHELRTPLNSVLGFAQLLRMGDLDALQLEAVDQILTAGRHLLGLLDEVLDLERLNTGRLDVRLEAVPVGPVLQEVLELVQPLAVSRDVAVDLRVGGWGTTSLLADPRRLRQVLLNLLTNAIKYNRRHGRVLVSCGGDAETLVVRVTDTGPGVPAARLDRLFTPFERLDADRRGIEGTGVGLSLSKHLTEAMGGAIGVESVPGQGSTFWIMLRVAAAGDAEAAASPRVGALDPARTDVLADDGGATRRRILYIEDNDANRRLVERVLREQDGVEVLTASRGEEGLALARLGAPDVVLLDLGLPDRDGRDVLHDLRSDPRTRDTPVVVVSADATPQARRELHEAGAAAYLTKPIDVADLYRSLQEAFAAAAESDDRNGSRPRGPAL